VSATDPDGPPSVRELLSPEGLRDPYVIYARFRRAEATGHDLGAVVVGYEAVIAALGDRRLSSDRAAGILQPLGVDVRGRCPMVERTLRSIVAFRDPPAHTRVRALMASAFGPRTVKRVADTIERISARLLDAVVDDGETDFHRAYSYPLPALVVGALLWRQAAPAVSAVHLTLDAAPAEQITSTSVLNMLPAGGRLALAFSPAGQTSTRGPVFRYYASNSATPLATPRSTRRTLQAGSAPGLRPASHAMTSARS